MSGNERWPRSLTLWAALAAMAALIAGPACSLEQTDAVFEDGSLPYGNAEADPEEGEGEGLCPFEDCDLGGGSDEDDVMGDVFDEPEDMGVQGGAGGPSAPRANGKGAARGDGKRP